MSNLSNCQVIVTSLCHCFGAGRRVPQSSNCWSPCNVQGKVREGRQDDDNGIFSNIEGVWSLGGREVP